MRIAAERMLRAIPITGMPSWAIPLADALVLVLAEPGGDTPFQLERGSRRACALRTVALRSVYMTLTMRPSVACT